MCGEFEDGNTDKGDKGSKDNNGDKGGEVKESYWVFENGSVEKLDSQVDENGTRTEGYKITYKDDPSLTVWVLTKFVNNEAKSRTDIFHSVMVRKWDSKKENPQIHSYEGGAVLPGINWEGKHDVTRKLPVVDVKDKEKEDADGSKWAPMKRWFQFFVGVDYKGPKDWTAPWIWVVIGRKAEVRVPEGNNLPPKSVIDN